MTDEPSGPKLAAELAGLRARLAEAENVLSAIRNGEVDALVVTGERGEHVYTLHGAYQQLSETMSEGVVTLSAGGVILYCNARLAQMLGRPLAEVLGTALRNYLPPEDQQPLEAILAQARTKSSRGEINLKSSEGRLVPVHLSASRLPGEEAEMVFCLVLTDLTGQKRREQMVADERLARLILEQAAEAIVVCDEQGRVIRANRAAQQFCDGSPLLQPFAEVFPLRTDASDPFQLAPVLQKETLRNVDVALDRQGQKFDLILNAGPLLSGQQVLGCVVNLTDITRRKGAEEAIRQSEERFRLIMESSKDLVAVLDLDGYRLYNNASYRDILGDPDSLRGSSSFDEIHPEDRERVRTVFRETARTGVGQRLEYRLLGRAGQTHHIESQGSVIRDDQGRVAKVLVVSRDVTERKRMEAALRQREEYFRALTERATDVITVLNADGIIRYESPAVEQVYGYKRDELVGRSVLDLIHPEDRARAQQALAESAATPGAATRIEVRFRHKDSSWRVLEATTRNLLDDPNVKGIVVNSRDTTERKQLEEALRESSQFNQQIVASAQEGIIVYGRHLKYQVWNPFMEQLTGMRADQVLGKHPDELFPFLREAGVLASIQKALAGEPTSSIDLHFDGLPSGKSGWTSDSNGPLRNAAGEIIGVIGIVHDMTERKRAELRIAAFASLGQRLNAAYTARQAREIIVDVADKLLGWDACLFDLYSAAENRISHVLNMDLIDGRRTECKRRYPDPSPRELSKRAIEQGSQLILRDHPEAVRTEGSPFGDISRPSASIMFVPVRHGTEIVGVLSIQSYTPKAYDAHSLKTLQALADHCGGALDRLRMEELLRGSEVRYRRLFEAAKDGVLILDAETGMVVDVNPFLMQLLGLSKEAFLGKKIWELGSFKDIVANFDRFKELQEEEYIRYDDKPLKTADGRRIDVEFVSNVYQVNHHSVIQCDIRDITARKRTEWLGLIYRDQLRALSARIESLREEERMRISREIHDELGQMLTGIKMDLRWMEHRLDEFGDDRRVNPILDKLVATAELTDATVKAVQRIAAELRPGILDNLGLPTALQYEAAQFEARTGIACRLVVPGDELTLRPEVATAFFRIFQEALTNVTRHAKATAVEVELQPEADGCRLEIRDNGRGMAGVELTNLKSLGLLGMQERASLLGGGALFAPRPGGGTVVTIRIPNSPTSKGGA
jgi:PAS domain S-box-containing protein